MWCERPRSDESSQLANGGANAHSIYRMVERESTKQRVANDTNRRLEETSLSWFFATKFDERGSINPDAEPCESFNNNPIILHEGDIRELSRMPSASRDFIEFAKSAMADDKCVYVDVSW